MKSGWEAPWARGFAGKGSPTGWGDGNRILNYIFLWTLTIDFDITLRVLNNN